MADLQAEIELTVELRKFFNIDLFVQGYYQIRAGIKFAPRIQAATKVEVKSETPPVYDDYREQIYPACVLNDWGVSKTFMILYKNEEVELEDQFNFKLSIIVDPQNITDCFNRMDMQLCIELYFVEKEYLPEKISAIQPLCSRNYKLHFNPRLGLHIHVPIFFDYFHLSALTVTIHASLLCLIPPYVFDRPNVRQTSLFSFLFDQDLSQITTDQINSNLLDRAYHLHNNICEILLSAYESLQDFYEKMIEHLPSNQQKPIHNHQKCRQRLKTLCDKLKSLDDIHTIDNLAHAHIAQCSAENIMLWCQFIDKFGLHDIPEKILAKEYHLKRVKRLSEGFFVREISRINLLTDESETFSDLHELVRNSLYYSRLPHLPIECVELDGVPYTLPTLIEEIYSPIDENSLIIPSSLNEKSNDENPILQTMQNINKIDPDSSHNVSEKVIEKTKNSGSNSITSPRIKSQEQKKGNISSANNNSKPLVRQPSMKRFLSFRNHSQSNIHPVLAISNEPFVKLTSIRKFNQDSTSSSIQSDGTNSSLGLFSNQSNSDLNLSLSKRSNSSCLSNQTARSSLPNVPYQRCNSASTTNINLSESSVIPPFLCTNDDDVFQTTDPVEVAAASTFGDSSMKSKVLRASFHGKHNTMDRRTTDSTSIRSLSTSSTTSPHNNVRQSLTSQPKDSITKTNDDIITKQPVNYPLDSVLNFTLQLEQKATADIQRRHTISMDNINPVLPDSLTEDENQLKENKQENDRLQKNSSINSQTIEYVVYKEKMKELILSKHLSNLMFFSDFSIPISPIPYFSQENISEEDFKETHLIVCLHGLDGNSGDLRLVKTYLNLCLPSEQLDFLMSSSNQSSTFDDIDIMAKQLIEEIDLHIDRYDLKPHRISFIGHSLGNLIIRAAVSHTNFEHYRPILYTFLSLSGPHLGTLFNTSGLVNMGMWLMQKWKKSCSLSQMSFKDHIDPKETYLYKLSKKPCLEFFKNILLVASPQDRYVPFHSSRIEVCKAALKDTVYGSIYLQMINNLLEPILRNPSITFVRYNAFHSIPAGTNNIIGRAAHIAILDSELFVEKLILVSAAKYFK
ncbi:unnamed protein product [Adineta steineri]|uniref:DUF676 domain-containing protein n=1 Tax=Adineta steineri TaxID=433720 RepID=A0A818FUY4_9BILA|nr:unnamed protein product [Adineta steineri]